MKLCSEVSCGAKVAARGLCSKHYQRAMLADTLPPTMPKICKVEGCGKKVEGVGHCRSHRRMFKKHGDPLIKGVSSTRFTKGHGKKEPVPCRVENCDNYARSLSYCKSHYMVFKRHGDASVKLKRPRGTALERFNYLVNKNGPVPEKRPNLGPCWTWPNNVDNRGYARFTDDSGWQDMVHRWSFKQFVGNIPEGFVVNHLCENPPCANPGHLEAINRYENTVEKGITNAAYINSLKTHCIHGHALTLDNIYTSKTKNGVARVCKKCHKERIVEYRTRKLLGLRADGKSVNKSGYHGITIQDNQRGEVTYLASTVYNGVQTYIGKFKTAPGAARAYDKKCLELYGPMFAYFNFPEELRAKL